MIKHLTSHDDPNTIYCGCEVNQVGSYDMPCDWGNSDGFIKDTLADPETCLACRRHLRDSLDPLRVLDMVDL